MKIVCRILQYTFLFIVSAFILLPVLWMLISSFKDTNEIYTKDLVWIPSVFKWSNYTDVLSETLLLKSFLNVMKIIVLPVLGGVFSSTMAGYAFAKLRFPGKNVIFILLFATVAVPGVVTMIPSYLLFKTYGWLGTLLPLIVPGMCGGVMMMFFIRQYMSGLPNDLQEAAIIDGLSYGGVFIRIFLPLAKPAILSQLILDFNSAYNNYTGPLLYINEEEDQVIQIVLRSFVSEYGANWSYMLAGSVLALLPTMLLFVVAQKYFVEGIALTGMKS